MPTIRIGDKRVRVSDDFLSLTPEDQNAVVEEIASNLGATPAASTPAGQGDVTLDNVVRAAARGIPIAGGAMDKFAAGMDALTYPLLGRGSQAETLSERYSENLPAEQARDRAFDTESPIASTAAQVTGGVGGLLPAAATKVGAKLLGLTGRNLTEQVTRGAASGAGINIADALVRGEDPTLAGEVGAGVGAAAPVIGRGIGKVAQGVRHLMTPDAPPVPQQTMPVGGAKVRMSQSQMTGDAAQSAEEQLLARGTRGVEAQNIVEDWRAGQRADLRAADDEIRREIDPTGRMLGTTPNAAAEAVSRELGQTAQQNAMFDAMATQAAAREGADIAAGMAGGRTVADAPYAAGEILSEGFRGAHQQARQARTAAYAAARAADIEVTPPALDRIENAIRTRLNEPERVRLNERTARANDAIETIRNGFGGTDLNAPPVHPGPDGRVPVRNITGIDIDELRKDLIALQRQANAAARGPQGDATDARAVGRIIDAYDDIVQDAVRVGTVRGDPEEFLRRMEAARQSHRDLRQRFHARGPDDETGKIVEKIIGRIDDQRATPDQIATWAYGSANDPGGATAIKVAQRIRQQFGPNSDEWAAYRQGLLAHLTEDVPGAVPRSPAQIADRVERFLTGTKGQGLAHVALSEAERTRLASYATQVRATEPRGRPADQVNRAIQHITGEDGGTPASVQEVIGMLYGSDAMGGRVSVQLANRLQRELTRDSWNAVRQGMYAELTKPPEGMLDYGAQKISQRLHNFLNGDGEKLAEAMFTQRERNLLGQMGDVYKRMIPVEGTTNPSGTAPMLAKIAARVQGVLLPLLGFAHGGMVGAGAGVLAQKGAERIVTRQAAKEATRRFYGDQPRVAAPPLRPSRLPTIVGQGAAPALTQ